MSEPSQRPHLHDSQISFREYGYFVRPLDPGAPIPGHTPIRASRWHRLNHALDRAKRGDFTADREVLDLYRESHAAEDGHEDPWFKRNAITILGNIGTVECYRDMRREIEDPAIREADGNDYYANMKIKDYCRAFCHWGRLDALPVILDQYLSQRLKDAPELDIFTVCMSKLLLPAGGSDSMIQEDPPIDMLEDYLNLVMNRYDEVVEELGSDKVHVAFGELSSARTLARHVITNSGPRRVRQRLMRVRERFEPMTGIDCTAFFADTPWTPLAAAAIAEDFLASDASARFEDGARYFFGHRIPE